MRKIECKCGITHDIYSWPSAEIEQNGKKMFERHLTCSCKREVVIRTSPKEEPDAEVNEDEKVATVSSFAEISRQFGVLKEAPAHNKPAAADPAPAGPAPSESGKEVSMLDANRALFLTLLENYAKWFKQGKASKEGQKKFFDLHERISKIPTGRPHVVVTMNDEEVRMARMALSPRNLFHIWGEEVPQAAQTWLDSLKSDLKEIL